MMQLVTKITILILHILQFLKSIMGSNQCAVQAPSPPYSVTPQIMEPAFGTQDTTKAINHAY